MTFPMTFWSKQNDGEKLDMMMHQTNKEHEEYEEACSTSEVQHAEKRGLWCWD